VLEEVHTWDGHVCHMFPARTQARSGESDLMPTPAGWYHSDCVHEVPNGAHGDIHRRVHLPDGRSYQIPLCSHPGRVAPPGPLPGARSTKPVLNGWLESAEYQPGGALGNINASWHVPAAPVEAFDSTPGSTQVYYTFPGLQSSSYIIQPVLTYGFVRDISGHYDYGGNYWSAASCITTRAPIACMAR